MDTTSYWRKSTSTPRFPKITNDCTVDVAIIGAGITGTTAAYLFKKAGYKVALVDRDRCGGFDSGNTTAHLTCVTDTQLHELVKTFGKDTAKAAWESGRAAIDQIYNNIQAEKIDCEFTWVPGYLHAPLKRTEKFDPQTLRDDADLANELGFPAEFLQSVPLMNRSGVKFAHQAKFHPRKYISGLLRTIPGKGSYVFENTDLEDVTPRTLSFNDGKQKIHYSYLVLATHNPLVGKNNVASATLFQTKLFLYTSYVVGAKLPSGAVEEASFWGTGDPYYYLRIDRHRGYDYAILGGEDHKTGQEKDTEAAYARLEAMLMKLLPDAKLDSRWSGQVLETQDGLPYIGENADHQFTATGFNGNGMTFGTLGAMMAVDAFLARKNPWQKLYDVHRKEVFSGAWDYLKENADYPYYMVRDWLGGAEGKSLKAVARGSGKILKLNGKKVAAYRNDKGEVKLCSPVCPHLGCIVDWNNAEKTWDCPCHGSRFAATGEVLSGPAESSLAPIEQPDEKR